MSDTLITCNPVRNMVLNSGHDTVIPCQERGGKTSWLMGVSLHGSAIYARHFCDLISDVLELGLIEPREFIGNVSARAMKSQQLALTLGGTA